MTAEPGAGPYGEMTDAELRQLATERRLPVDAEQDRDGLLGVHEAHDQYKASGRAGTDAYGGTGDQTPDQSALVGSTDEGPGGVRRATEPAPPDDSKVTPATEEPER